jgi:hypothetical protein
MTISDNCTGDILAAKPSPLVTVVSTIAPRVSCFSLKISSDSFQEIVMR